MNDYRIFNEYKEKIINAFDFQDAESLLDIGLTMASDNVEKKLLYSILNKDKYNNKMDFDRFLIYLNILSQIEYKNNADILIDDLESTSLINDMAQLNTLRRIACQKPDYDPIINKKYYLQVCCPHCNKKNTGTNTSTYVICGYNAKGYDWKGCGKDWCFKCGKKLCKNWTTDHLYNKQNRIHDNKCCKSFATKIEDQYPENYCCCKGVDYIKAR